MNKLIHGKDTFLSLREARQEVKNLMDKDKEKVSIDGDKISPDEFSDILNASSLFSSKRILFVKRLYRNKKKDTLQEILLKYLATEHNETDIILWEDQKIRSITKYYKYFQKSKDIFESPELNKRTFLTWAQEEINTNKTKMDKESIRLLSERSNFNTETFSNEIQKLKLTGKETFTKEDIINNSTDTLEYDIWKLIDSINSEKEISERMEVLEKILSQEVDVNYIISMLARNLRLTVLIKDLSEKNTSLKDIASTLRIPPFTIPQMMKTAKEYSFEKISLLYEKLSSLDYEVKRGSIEPGLGLTLLITKF